MNASEPIQAGVRTIRVARVAPSPTNPRKHFDEAAQAELTASVRRHGIIQPILVRPLSGARDEIDRAHYHYELVAGERRLRAADAAGLAEIPALVRELTDAEVLEIQVIENLQRADLHPLEEAEGYEQLHNQHGYAVADIAAKVGKSAAYVYARMKLTALCEAARKAFYAGKLTARTALLIARIPGLDLQAQATKEIAEPRYDGAEPMSATAASEHIQRNYMLRLATAPFKPGDKDLLPEAGACTTCPKRTGNAGDLFADIKGPDTCTDPACFERKSLAHKDRQVEQAHARGTKVIDGDAAKKLVPYAHSTPKGYRTLDDRAYEVPGNKTVRQIVAKTDVERVLIVNPHTHALIEAVAEKALQEALVERGIKPARSTLSAQEKQQRAKLELDKAWRMRLFGTLRAAREYVLEDRRIVARAMFDRLGEDLAKRIRDVWSWSKNNAEEGVDGLELEQLDRLMIDMALVSDTLTWAYSTSKPEKLLALAARLGVDAEAIRREVVAEAKEKARAKAKATTPKKKPGNTSEKKVAKKVAKKAEKKASGKRTPAKARRTSVAPAAAQGAPAQQYAGTAWPFPTAPK